MNVTTNYQLSKKKTLSSYSNSNYVFFGKAVYFEKGSFN